MTKIIQELTINPRHGLGGEGNNEEYAPKAANMIGKTAKAKEKRGEHPRGG